ncbi:MAG: polymorphic toxin type 15 domain-containing protein [Bacillota bacterium]
MKKQAALHNPDQIAGGNPLNIEGMGDKKINTSIGSQWKYRIDVIDEQIREISKKYARSNKKNNLFKCKTIKLS